MTWHPLVEVVGGDENDVGTFSLMTISVSKATSSFLRFIANFPIRKSSFLLKMSEETGENDKEYNVRQKKLMSDSQFNAITVAFEKAGLPVDIEYDGVFVMMVLEGGAADGILELGDKIRVS